MRGEAAVSPVPGLDSPPREPECQCQKLQYPGKLLPYFRLGEKCHNNLYLQCYSFKGKL